MYLNSDFDIFNDTTLAGRLEKIKTQIDPKFMATVTAVQPQLATIVGPVYAHVAQHRRRSKNPPPDTWVAWSTSKRGYKMLPHLELGLWDDRLFIWLVVLQEVRQRQATVARVSTELLTALPANFEWAIDHTDKTDHQPLTLTGAQQLMTAQRHPHAEWLVGRTFPRGSAFFTGHAARQLQTIQATLAALIPLYRALLG